MNLRDFDDDGDDDDLAIDETAEIESCQKDFNLN